MKRKYDYAMPEFERLFCLKYSIHEIGKMTNIDYRIVWKYLKEKNLRRSMSEAKKIYDIDENVFSILNHETAYWLGCLYGDGSFCQQNNAICLHGHIDDVSHAEQFKLFLKSTHPIKKCKNKKAYYFCFTSKRIKENLSKIGCVINKSKDVKYPIFENPSYHASFIRGLFDTDGNIHFRLRPRYVSKQGCFSITVNKFLTEGIEKNIYEQLGIMPTGHRIKHVNTNTKTISYEGNIRLQKIKNWLYEDNTNCFLSRKKEYFFENLKNY